MKTHWITGEINFPKCTFFQITVNGTVNLDEIRATNQRNTETKFDKKDIILFEKKILLLFYFLAKSMIHLPVIATKPLPKNVDNATKKKQSMFNNDSKGATNQDHMILDVDMTSPCYKDIILIYHFTTSYQCNAYDFPGH